MTPTTLAVAAVDALARFAALALTTARVVLAVADAVAHPALGLVMTFAASVLVASTLGGDRAPPFVLVLLLVYALGGGWRACASAEELAMMRARGHRTPKAMRAATRAIARALGADGGIGDDDALDGGGVAAAARWAVRRAMRWQRMRIGGLRGEDDDDEEEEEEGDGDGDGAEAEARKDDSPIRSSPAAAAAGTDETERWPTVTLPRPEEWPHRPVFVRFNPKARSMRAIGGWATREGPAPWRDDDDALWKDPNQNPSNPSNPSPKPPSRERLCAPVNTETSMAFESELFVGRIVCRFKGVGCPGNARAVKTTDAFFKRRRVTFQVLVQGKFKEPCLTSDILTGAEFKKPFENRPPDFLVTAGIAFFAALTPGLETDVLCDEPWCVLYKRISPIARFQHLIASFFN